MFEPTVALDFHVQRDPSMRGVRLYVTQRDPRTGDVSTVRPLVVEKVPDGEMIPTAACITYEAADRLIDQLWKEGFRPTDIKDDSGQIEAMKEHIKDLRRIKGRVE
jgi:hypothetical protein